MRPTRSLRIKSKIQATKIITNYNDKIVVISHLTGFALIATLTLD